MDALLFDNRLFPFCFPAALSFLACAFLTYNLRNTGQSQPERRYWGPFFVLLGIGNLGSLLLTFAANDLSALFIVRVGTLARLFCLPVFIQLVHAFSDELRNKRAKWIESGLFLICVVLAPFTWTDLFWWKTVRFFFGWFPQAGPVYYVFPTLMLLALIYAVLVVGRLKHSHQSPLERDHSRYMLICITAIMIFNFGNVVTVSGVAAFPLGNLVFIPLWILIHGMFHKNLFGINPFVRKRNLGNVVRLLVGLWFVVVMLSWYWCVYPFEMVYILKRIFPCGLPPLLTLLACGYLATLSLRLGQNQKEALIFAMICLLYGNLNLDILILGIVPSKETAMLVSQMDHMLFVFVIGLSLHLIYLVTRRQKMWGVVYMAYLFGLVLMPFTQTHAYFPDMRRYYWGYFAQGGILFNLFGAVSLMSMVYSTVILIQGYRKAENQFFKQRILFLALGFVGFGLLTFSNIPTLEGYEIYPPGNFAFIPLMLTAYGLFKNNLKQALKMTKTWLYWPLLLGTLIGVAWILKDLVHSKLPLGTFFVVSLFMVVAYQMIQPLLEGILSLIFGRPEEKLERVLDAMMDKLSQAHTLQSIYQTVREPIFEELLSENCAMLVLNEALFVGGLQAVHAENDFSGWRIWNAEPSLFKSRHRHSQVPEPITVSADHPMIPAICRHRSLLTHEQIQVRLADQLAKLSTEQQAVNSHLNILFQAALIQPIFFQEQLICLILLGYKIDGGDYQEDEKEFIRRLGMALGPPIENAKLLQNLETKVAQRTRDLKSALEETQHKEKEISHINQVVRTINSTLDFDTVAHSVMKVLYGIFEFDIMAVFLLDEAHDRLDIYKIYGERVQPEHIIKYQEITLDLWSKDSIVGHVVSRKKTVYRTDVTRDRIKNPSDCRLWEVIPFDTILILPLESRNQVFGTINFITIEPGSALTASQIGKIQQYVSHLSVAINNARLYNDLEIARQLAEEAAQAKSDFLAKMSHEIRTPMNAILGLSRLVLRTEMTLQQKDYLQKIIHSAKMLLGIINDILDFSKIEAGMMAIDAVDFNLSTVLDNLPDLVNIRSDRSELALIVEIDKDVPRNVIGDPLRLGQILTNLVGNAVKFTPQGEIRIRVKQMKPIEAIGPDQVVLEFSVKDTGIGLTTDQIDKLFQRFAQADTSITRQYGGTGLGLAITKRLVEMLDGRIWVVSEPRKGSTFSFTARFGLGKPLMSTTVPSGPVSLSNALDWLLDVQPEFKRALEALQERCVLVAEDNVINQQVVQELLESVGLSVELAHSGKEVLEKLTQEKQEGDSGTVYQAILMDLQMPEMDGYTACRRIRKLKTDIRHIPIIALSAHAMAIDIQKCIDAGMNDHVAKPIDPSALFSTLIKWIAPDQIVNDLEMVTFKVSDAELDLQGVLPEIDIAAALKRAAGNKALYGKLLEMFHKKYKDTFSVIGTLSEESAFSRIKRLAHEIKGVCGNLGADSLCLTFANLEAAATHQDKRQIETILTQNSGHFSQIMNGIRYMATELAPTRRNVQQLLNTTNLDSAIQYIQEILDLMDTDYSQALDRFMNLKLLVGNPEYQNDLQRLDQDLHTFEEHSAKTGLIRFSRRLEMAREESAA